MGVAIYAILMPRSKEKTAEYGTDACAESHKPFMVLEFCNLARDSKLSGMAGASKKFAQRFGVRSPDLPIKGARDIRPSRARPQAAASRRLGGAAAPLSWLSDSRRAFTKYTTRGFSE